jgi:hypothetical protein
LLTMEDMKKKRIKRNNKGDWCIERVGEENREEEN